MRTTAVQTEEQIAAIVREFIREAFFFGDELRLADDASFMETGVIDSTGVLELIGFIEEEFGLYVEEAEITPNNLDSLRRISAYVKRKLHSQPAD